MDEKLKSILRNFSFEKNVSTKALQCLEGMKEFCLPGDYISFMRATNGGEGFVGSSYLILWKAEELETLNEEYGVEQYAPGLFLFGSNGGGEAFGFDTREKPYEIIQIPFVGMDLRYSRKIAESFLVFLEKLVENDSGDLNIFEGYIKTERELFEITPIILGGSPTDKDNKIELAREEHIKLTRYWNDFIQAMKSQGKS